MLLPLFSVVGLAMGVRHCIKAPVLIPIPPCSVRDAHALSWGLLKIVEKLPVDRHVNPRWHLCRQHQGHLRVGWRGGVILSHLSKLFVEVVHAT